MPLVMVDKVPLRLHLRTTFIPFHSALTTSGLVICSSSLTRGAPLGRVRYLSARVFLDYSRASYSPPHVSLWHYYVYMFRA